MKVFRFWGPVILWMGVIFLFSSRQRIQVSEQGMVNFLFFKTLHIIEYAFLFALSYRALKNTRKKGHHREWLWGAFAITLLYAISDEIHQTFVPTREGKLRDVIIDAAGALFSWYLIATLLPKAPKRLQQWAKNWQMR